MFYLRLGLVVFIGTLYTCVCLPVYPLKHCTDYNDDRGSCTANLQEFDTACVFCSVSKEDTGHGRCIAAVDTCAKVGNTTAMAIHVCNTTYSDFHGSAFAPSAEFMHDRCEQNEETTKIFLIILAVILGVGCLGLFVVLLVCIRDKLRNWWRNRCVKSGDYSLHNDTPLSKIGV